MRSSPGTGSLSRTERPLIPPLELTGLTKIFKTPTGPFVAVKDVNATVDAGEFVAILGHSGCGKSTLVRSVVGLVWPDEGQVEVDGERVEVDLVPTYTSCPATTLIRADVEDTVRALPGVEAAAAPVRPPSNPSSDATPRADRPRSRRGICRPGGRRRRARAPSGASCPSEVAPSRRFGFDEAVDAATVGFDCQVTVGDCPVRHVMRAFKTNRNKCPVRSAWPTADCRVQPLMIFQIKGRIESLLDPHPGSTAAPRLLREIDDAARISREVADRRVHLRDRNFHGPNILSPVSRTVSSKQ